MSVRESRCQTGDICFSNNNKAQCLLAGFCPDPHAFWRCLESAAPRNSAVGLFFSFECVFFSFFPLACRYVQNY